MTTISLHSRLLLASIVPTGIFMAIFSILLILFRFEDIQTLEQESAEILLGKYSLAIASQSDSTQFNAIIQTALNEKYIHAISIVDAQGHALAHAGPQLTTPLSSTDLQPKNGKNKRNNNSDLFVQALPMFNTNHRQYWLAIELRHSVFTIARYEAIIGITIIGFGLITILTLLLSGGIRRWLEPIYRMAQQLKEIDSHHLNKRLTSQAVGDLSLLEEAINSLLTIIEHEHTDLKQSIDQANADLNESSEDMEVKNIELRMARNDAVEGNRVKSEFLANISHELRTPLNSINGFSQLLLKMQLQYKQRDYVETIQKSSNNLLAIINDVLDFSKIEAGKFSLEKQPFFIEDAIFEVLESLSPQIGQKDLEQIAFIYDDVPKKIIGDALRLKQVLTNLVSNAIKFTKQGEVVIRVMVEDSRPNHHLLRVSITDTGIGLSKSAQQDLFQAFQQGNPSVSRQFGGTGLGLVISKNIVKLMEGEISFDAEQEQGTTFWFTFKAWLCHDHVDSDISLPHKNVIALEPHEKSAQLLKATLFRANSTLHVVKTWPSLLETIDSHYQILLLNGQMLTENTHEKLQELRQQFHGMIVIFTRLSEHHLEQADIERFQLYALSKPIRPRTLLTLIAQGLSTAKLHVNLTTLSTPDVSKPEKTVNLHILAVDDHPLNLKLVCTLLEDLGIQVTSAENGLEAVALAKTHRFDLIIMDIQMPEMSGLEATKAIRLQEEAGQHVPIVALTAHALADEKDIMLKQGMDDYLTKPLQESQLIHAIEHWTGVSLTAPITNDNTVIKSEHLVLVDWQESLKLAAGKTDLAQDMLKMLLNGLTLQRDKILSSQRDHNFPALLAHTHYLHGATRYCGVPQLRAATQQLEVEIKQALKNNIATEDINLLLQAPIQQLIDVMNALVAWRESSEDAHVITQH